MTVWEPFQSGRSNRLRVTETSCCGAYEWVCQGGLFLVLRHTKQGYEETGRGLYRQARAVWDALVIAHLLTHGTRIPSTAPAQRPDQRAA
ncbi:hypothetical protein SAMN05660976_08351 [Nonomuraea pusilla]|uniref:Uncharacterized protein n=1 Tax=Nonomuraea pusilla TaxID=46177 RepID=A0A1H8JIW6_9ACTN|nr:hypothetical protein SAMN05660976_08351 [Nonomuraea pusilla]